MSDMRNSSFNGDEDQFGGGRDEPFERERREEEFTDPSEDEKEEEFQRRSGEMAEDEAAGTVSSEENFNHGMKILCEHLFERNESEEIEEDCVPDDADSDYFPGDFMDAMSDYLLSDPKLRDDVERYVSESVTVSEWDLEQKPAEKTLVNLVETNLRMWTNTVGETVSEMLVNRLVESLIREYSDDLLFGIVKNVYLTVSLEMSVEDTSVSFNYRLEWSKERGNYPLELPSTAALDEENRDLLYLIVGDLLSDLLENAKEREIDFGVLGRCIRNDEGRPFF